MGILKSDENNSRSLQKIGKMASKNQKTDEKDCNYCTKVAESIRLEDSVLQCSVCYPNENSYLDISSMSILDKTWDKGKDEKEDKKEDTDENDEKKKST